MVLFAEHKKPLAFLAGSLIALALLTGCGPTNPPVTNPTSESTVPITEALAADGVSANGISFGGMNLEEVKTALEPVVSIYTTTDLVVKVAEEEHILPASAGVARLDVDAAAQAILKAQPGVLDLSAFVTIDEDALTRQLDALESILTVPSVPTSWTVVGEMPSLAPLEEEPVCQSLTLVKGTTGQVLDREALAQAITDAYATRSFSVIGAVTPNEPEVFDINTVHTLYYLAPVDAVMDMETFEVLPEVYGYSFDTAAAQAAWDAASEGEEIIIPFSRVAPAVSKETLSSLLFRDVLGSSNTPHTNSYNRNNNLKLACKALNGKVIMPGETFSYNKTLGKRTPEKGYLPAGAYSNGQQIESVGGGICQVSSTLYNAVLKSDLEIVLRKNHGMTVSYVKLGLDATVDWGNIDFKFKNNTNYPIRIEAKVSGGYVRIQLVGTDERDYYIKMVSDVNETYPYETIYQEMYANNPEGYKDGDVIIKPFTGYKVTTYRCKYDKETDKLISKEKEAVSSYRTVDKVVCKIIPDPNAPTVPPETQPPETQPPETQPPAHEHQYTDEVTAPTCEEGGYTTHTCSCGHSYTDNETAALGHSYTAKVVAPTESEQGYTEHTCTRCGHSYRDSYTDPLPPPSTEPPETEPDPTEAPPTESTEPAA